MFHHFRASSFWPFGGENSKKIKKPQVSQSGDAKFVIKIKTEDEGFN